MKTLESFHDLLKKCATEYMPYTIKTVVGKLHLKKSNAEVILESFNNLKMSTKMCNSAIKASHVITYLEYPHIAITSKNANYDIKIKEIEEEEAEIQKCIVIGLDRTSH